MTGQFAAPAPTAPTASANPEPDLSVVVLVTERSEPLDELYREYAPVLLEAHPASEFLFVLDPGFRHAADGLRTLVDAGEPIRILMAAHTLGETALLNVAVHETRAERILTLPAYHRVRAEALPGIVQRLDAGADLVSARRWPRTDSWINRVQNRAFHALLRRAAGGSIQDVASGIRAMRRTVLTELVLYGDFARFLPVLAGREGFRVEEIDAPQHPRDSDPRVYGPGIYLRRLLDVLGLFFLVRFTQKPLRFFGLLGSGVSLTGLIVLALLAVQRLQGQGIADRPLLLLGVLLLVVGIQAIALGLIGEIIVHLNAPRRPPYRLARTTPAAGDSAGTG